MKRLILVAVLSLAAPVRADTTCYLPPLVYCPPRVVVVGPVALPPVPQPPAVNPTPITPMPGADRSLAVPQAAPPSATPEPPTAAPRVGETTTALKPRTAFYELLSGPGTTHSRDGCSVAFWNLTGRPVTLRIDGREQTLAAGRTLALNLARSFVWQVDGGASETVRLPEGRATAEMLIRR